jgi:hypothetical protein
VYIRCCDCAIRILCGRICWHLSAAKEASLISF